MRRNLSIQVIPFVLSAFLLGCLFLSSASADTLKVFAAASLTDALKEFAANYEKDNPGEKVEFNFAGSQLLRTQIEQGAPADVFISADLVHMNALKRADFIASFERLARNQLVVVTPTKGAKVNRLQDLARPGVKVILAAPAVPAGRYAAQMLAKMSRNAVYGDDFQTRVTNNVVSQETNVRAVLAKVLLGEADAGIVYATDAAAVGEKVRTISVPLKDNIIAVYPIGALAKSPAKERTSRLVRELLGAKGQTVLKKYGFLPPHEKTADEKRS